MNSQTLQPPPLPTHPHQPDAFVVFCLVIATIAVVGGLILACIDRPHGHPED